MLDYQPLFQDLTAEGCGDWASQLQTLCAKALDPDSHGHLADWITAVQRMPCPESATLNVAAGRVTVSGDLSSEQQQKLRRVLMQFCPWRKGPFELCGIPVDTEWRSDLKWDRLAADVELRDRSVLDIGCGNGYYGWRMLHQGARRVVGFDPFLLYVLQHEIISHLAGGYFANYVLPLGDADLPSIPAVFEVAFSMGVLYHRTAPIDHLRTLNSALKPGGQLVLETLVLEDPQQQVLVPRGRYAQMRNVWFIPSVELLNVWLTRTGFVDIRVVDLSRTSPAEQRRTEWMSFESLSDFLDPADPTKTVEGHPAPLRAMITATARP